MYSAVSLVPASATSRAYLSAVVVWRGVWRTGGGRYASLARAGEKCGGVHPPGVDFFAGECLEACIPRAYFLLLVS